ncbi:efflux RND transporter periplasmic adaptor subunit [Lichenibacterium ramalinae]|uniref:HlyD family secretion protein n=1 Tax=Lichenibacterium ramalinae TaxID=2316527 RepID=A0A4V1RIA1_9HYPH|nr:HlyD family secretion protein [Lichenibacterium ramalinae]RYB02991.1 HlyD family secretion protein [Lichenibacterium ramalinae]
MTALLALLGRMAVTVAAVLAAAVVGGHLWTYYMEAPWTRDGRVRADVVEVAPDVSGLVSEVAVRDNQPVRQGDLLFRIDRDRFMLALREADANLASRRAALDLATANAGRYGQLTDAVVTKEKREEIAAAQQQAQAATDQALADRDLARLNLARSDVRASVTGTITNMDLRPGTYVAAGHGTMALVDAASLHVDGYFEETKLPRIRMGDPVRVRLMGEDRDIAGRVESIAGGIEDRERGASASLLANINPSFTWVRLAQRVPVRIALDRVPDGVALIPGRTATVEVEQLPERQASR